MSGPKAADARQPDRSGPGRPDLVILLAHGSTREEWKRPFEGVLRRLRQSREADTADTAGAEARPRLRLAYMQFAEPSLETALDQSSAEGLRHVAVLPLFIAVGTHLRRDIPQLIDEYRMKNPEMRIELLPALGEDESFLDMMAEYLHNSIET